MSELKMISRRAICKARKYQSAPNPVRIATNTFFETIIPDCPEILVFGNGGSRL
ncbi:MAG TPA: hypothetical protein VKR53_21970 [Puia sp.]|nr:hypothetical protein [Puia sp.]